MDWQTRMNRALDRIEETLTGEIDLDGAARLACCSKWELTRIFSFVSHIPLGEYIRRRRLAKALGMLTTGDAKVIDVAMDMGYESPAAFSRAFRQEFGITPLAARRGEIGLKPMDRLRFPENKEGIAMKKGNDMEAYGSRGYYVKENAPVYFTRDIRRTCDWFRDVLGWYGDIIENTGDEVTYSCVFDYPGELIVSGLTPFRGIHLFKGEPSKGVVGFILVQGLDKLCSVVKGNGWDKVSDIIEQPWGARECQITTIDGSVIRFFETV